MKSKLKYIIASILILSFTLMGSVCASAEEITKSKVSVEDYENDANFFEKVYDEVMAYTSEILCALTFAGSIGVAFAYSFKPFGLKYPSVVHDYVRRIILAARLIDISAKVKGVAHSRRIEGRCVIFAHQRLSCVEEVEYRLTARVDAVKEGFVKLVEA